jgi:hypothetical protein
LFCVGTQLFLKKVAIAAPVDAQQFLNAKKAGSLLDFLRFSAFLATQNN